MAGMKTFRCFSESLLQNDMKPQTIWDELDKKYNKLQN